MKKRLAVGIASILLLMAGVAMIFKEQIETAILSNMACKIMYEANDEHDRVNRAEVLKGFVGFPANAAQGKDYAVFNENVKWFIDKVDHHETEVWEQIVPEDYAHPDEHKKHTITLKAKYLSNCSDTTVIIAHGYAMNAYLYGSYAKLFYDLGYNVLLPDARAHGDSGGRYISFGYQEKNDYVRENGWIDQVIRKVGAHSKIILDGTSMGASTMLMVSGEKLPDNVKLVIADCGFASLKEPVETIYTKIRDMIKEHNDRLEYAVKIAGFRYQLTVTREKLDRVLVKLQEDLSAALKIDGDFSDLFQSISTNEQVKKSRVPILFIHGEKDTLVPVSNTFINMKAKKENPYNDTYECYIARGAGHGSSIKVDYAKYQKTISAFIGKYL